MKQNRLSEERVGDNRLMISLLEVAHGVEMRLEAELKALGLSRTLFETLEQLATSGQSLTMCELAEGQRCAASNITQKMDRLERDGLARRVDDPSDRRIVLAEITELGRAKAEQARKIVDQIQQDFETQLSLADRDSLGRVLESLR